MKRMNEVEYDEKVERSRPVQSRVDVLTLAKLDRYWMGEGVEIRSLSQLLSWSMDLLLETIEANGYEMEEMDLNEAHKYLGVRGLIQQSMLRRGQRKLGTALTFKTMREYGMDPKGATPDQYKVLHKERKDGGGLKPLNGEVEVESVGVCSDVVEEAFRRLEEEKSKDQHENTRKAIEAARENGMVLEDWEIKKMEYQSRAHDERKVAKERVLKEGVSDEELDVISSDEKEHVVKEGMSEEELYKVSREREADIMARENAPFDPSLIETVKEEPNQA